MLWLLVIILAVLAIGGGVALSKFLFLLLIAALIVALFGAFGGRTLPDLSSTRLAPPLAVASRRVSALTSAPKSKAALVSQSHRSVTTTAESVPQVFS